MIYFVIFVLLVPSVSSLFMALRFDMIIEPKERLISFVLFMAFALSIYFVLEINKEAAVDLKLLHIMNAPRNY